MTDEQARRLEEIRQQWRLAAEAIAQRGDAFECCEKLVDTIGGLIRFLEAENNQCS
jgi:hypothetical protein